MWDEEYSVDEYLYGTEPNDFLLRMTESLKKGRVVCLAEGEGRNAVPDVYGSEGTGRKMTLKTSAYFAACVDGGATIQGFLDAGLIDEITVTVIPVILGSGISPYRALENEIKLVNLCAKVFEFGFVKTTYSVQGNA